MMLLGRQVLLLLFARAVVVDAAVGRRNGIAVGVIVVIATAAVFSADLLFFFRLSVWLLMCRWRMTWRMIC